MKRLALAIALSLVVVACGDDAAPVTTTAPGATTTAGATTTTAAEGAVSGLDLVAGLMARENLGTTTTVAGASTTVASVDDYVAITDDTGQIELRVPASWADLDTRAWVDEGVPIGPGLVAAPDVAAWRAEWGTPGVFIGATSLFGGETPDTVLDSKRWDSFCTYEGRDDYDDGLYVGRFDLYYDCGDELSVFFVIAAEPADQSFMIVVEIVIVTEDDLAAADEIIRTFLVSGATF